MPSRRMAPAFSARIATFAYLCTIVVLVTAVGCSSGPRGQLPTAPGTVVTGTLVAIKDDRPMDGGIDLTLATGPGVREVVRVPSAFRPPPRDEVLAMHAVVDASKIGDRLRARGTRDESGTLRVEHLERLSF